jgi:hypothetical protein
LERVVVAGKGGFDDAVACSEVAILLVFSYKLDGRYLERSTELERRPCMTFNVTVAAERDEREPLKIRLDETDDVLCTSPTALPTSSSVSIIGVHLRPSNIL